MRLRNSNYRAIIKLCLKENKNPLQQLTGKEEEEEEVNGGRIAVNDRIENIEDSSGGGMNQSGRISTVIQRKCWLLDELSIRSNSIWKRNHDTVRLFTFGLDGRQYVNVDIHYT